MSTEFTRLFSFRLYTLMVVESLKYICQPEVYMFMRPETWAER